MGFGWQDQPSAFDLSEEDNRLCTWIHLADPPNGQSSWLIFFSPMMIKMKTAIEMAMMIQAFICIPEGVRASLDSGAPFYEL